MPNGIGPEDPEIAGGPQGAGDAAAGTPPSGASPMPGGPPPGGGPMLASIARRQQGPQISAPGPGDMANAMTQITTAIGMIQQALGGLQAGTPIHKDALRAVQSLSRHLNQGQPTVGVQRTQLQDMLQSVARNALLSSIMGQQKQARDPGAPAGAMPPGMAGGMNPAPMPSTPLPGA